jgi:hypothetical protein
MASFLRRFRFPIAVALTSVALVAALVGVAALLVPNAVARGAVWAGGPGGPWYGGHGFGGPGFTLPPELQGLLDVPADQRFSHFLGAQINLTDKNNQPLTINVTPGTVTAASATSLTIAANDGTSKTYTLDANTIIRGKGVRDSSQATQPTLAQNDKVVVVTLNNNTNATAVMAGDMNGFGPHGPGGPWGRFGPGR